MNWKVNIGSVSSQFVISEDGIYLRMHGCGTINTETSLCFFILQMGFLVTFWIVVPRYSNFFLCNNASEDARHRLMPD